MIKNSIILIWLSTLILAQDPCSNFWQFLNNETQTEGVLTLPLDNLEHDHNIEVILAIEMPLPNVSI